MAGMSAAHARQSNKNKAKRLARRAMDKTGINKLHNIAKAKKLANKKLKTPHGTARALRRATKHVTANEEVMTS